MGESGSGKSTLALTILRLLPPAAKIVSGEILFEGENLLAMSDAEMRRVRGKRIAMILQDPMASLNPLFTIGDQVSEPLRVHEGVGRRSAWSRATDLLKAVRIPAPEARVREYPHQMSGGMRQRIVGAIAISCAPRLLIADEPTTSLDLTIQAQYLNLLRDLQREHRLALIFITHNLGIVAKMCDQVAVMYGGRLVEWGPVTRIFDAPRPSLHPRAARVDPAHGRRPGAPHRHRGPAAGPGRAADRLRLPPALPPGHGPLPRGGAARDRRSARATPRAAGSTCRPPSTAATSMTDRAPLLEARNLTKHFPVRRGFLAKPLGVVRAVDGVTFSIGVGKTLGVVGESGCGKTTTAKLVLRLEEPTGGALLFDGQDISGLEGREVMQYRKAVQAVFQDPFASLNPRMRVDAIISEPLITHERLDAAEVDKRVARLIDLVGLPERSAKLFPHEFSGGQRQRIAIARSLAVSPRLVVLDEPVSALDVSIRAQILNLLRDLQAQLGLSYLFIAHDLAAVAHMSHTIAVMYLGQIVEIGDAAAIATRPRAPVHPGPLRGGPAVASRRSSARSWCSPARSRARSTRRSPAASTPAARTRWPAARARSRCSAKRRGGGWPATSTRRPPDRGRSRAPAASHPLTPRRPRRARRASPPRSGKAPAAANSVRPAADGTMIRPWTCSGCSSTSCSTSIGT